MKSFISLEEAIYVLNESINKLEVEEISLVECTNRVLAEDIYSKIDNPPFDKSAMDTQLLQKIVNLMKRLIL